MPELTQTGDELISHALKAVDPYNLVLDQVAYQDGKLIIQKTNTIDLSSIEHVYIIGMGKGTAPMAAALESLLGDRIDDGAVIVKYDHTYPLDRIKLFEAGHPVPDQNTLEHTKPLLEILDRAKENDLIIVLITGGGSALLEALPAGITLEHLAETNRQLLSSGATIQDINTMRKHISEVKGGRLAKRVWPATTISLILSDVIGDPLESIASGPTSPDPTTFADAWDVIERFDLKKSLPESILKRIQSGKEGAIEDTPDHTDAIFSKVKNFVIGNNFLVIDRVEQRANKLGFSTLMLTDQVQGEAREIAKLIAGMIKSALEKGIPVEAPGCIVFGGEPTVTIRGEGLGGRNQELSLAVLQCLGQVEREFYFCSVGTDGTDGPTDAAGAWIDHRTMHKVKEKALDPFYYLNHNDAYHFFEAIGQLIKTGPTRTNVMDLMIILIR